MPWFLETANMVNWARSGFTEWNAIDKRQSAPIIYNSLQNRAYNNASSRVDAIEWWAQYVASLAVYYLGPWLIKKSWSLGNRALGIPEGVAPPVQPERLSYLRQGWQWLSKFPAKLPFVGAALNMENKVGATISYLAEVAAVETLSKGIFSIIKTSIRLIANDFPNKLRSFCIAFLRPFYERMDAYYFNAADLNDVNFELRDLVPNLEGTPLQIPDFLRKTLSNLLAPEAVSYDFRDSAYWAGDLGARFLIWIWSVAAGFVEGAGEIGSYILDMKVDEGLVNIKNWLDENFGFAFQMMFGKIINYMKDAGAIALDLCAEYKYWGVGLATVIGALGFYFRREIWNEVQHWRGRDAQNINVNLVHQLNQLLLNPPAVVNPGLVNGQALLQQYNALANNDAARLQWLQQLAPAQQQQVIQLAAAAAQAPLPVPLGG